MDDLGVPLFQETSICVHAPASQSPNPSTPTPTQPATAAPEGVAKQRLLWELNSEAPVFDHFCTQQIVMITIDNYW